MANPVAVGPSPRCAHCVSAGSTYTEEHRHSCEVRYALSLKREDRLRYYDGVGSKRGHAEARRLIDDVRALYAATGKSNPIEQSSLL